MHGHVVGVGPGCWETLPPAVPGSPTVGKLRPGLLWAVEHGTRAHCLSGWRWARRGPAQLVPQDGFSAVRARAHHSPRSASVPGSGSWREARLSIRGRQLQTGAQAGGRRSGCRTAWAEARTRAGSACCPAWHRGAGTREAGAPRGPGRGATTAPVPGAPGELAGDAAQCRGAGAGAGRGPVDGLRVGSLGKAWWLEPPPQQPRVLEARGLGGHPRGHSWGPW